MQISSFFDFGPGNLSFSSLKDAYVGNLLVGVNLDCDGEILVVDLFKCLSNVLRVVSLNPGLDKVVVGSQHDEVFAHRLGNEAREEGLHLGRVDSGVAHNLFADAVPGLCNLLAVHMFLRTLRRVYYLLLKNVENIIPK